MAAPSPIAERRRGTRVSIRIPIRLLTKNGDGTSVNARAEAVAISRYGALVRTELRFAPALGSRVEVLNANNQEIQEFRIVRVAEKSRNGVLELGVEMLYPSRSFWGIYFSDERSFV